jgi:hypothetical protein
VPRRQASLGAAQDRRLDRQDARRPAANLSALREKTGIRSVGCC